MTQEVVAVQEVSAVQEAQQQPEVHVRHIRLIGDHKSPTNNRGGATLAYMSKDENVTEFAVAYCNPKDNFHRIEGRNRAAGRLHSFKRSMNIGMSLAEFEDQVMTLFTIGFQNNADLAEYLNETFGAPIPAVYIRL